MPVPTVTVLPSAPAEPVEPFDTVNEPNVELSVPVNVTTVFPLPSVVEETEATPTPCGPVEPVAPV